MPKCAGAIGIVTGFADPDAAAVNDGADPRVAGWDVDPQQALDDMDHV